MITIEAVISSSNIVDGKWKFKFNNTEKIVPNKIIQFIVSDEDELYDVIDIKDFIWIMRKDTKEILFDIYGASYTKQVKNIEDD